MSSRKQSAVLSLLLVALIVLSGSCLAETGEMMDLSQEQAKEKAELEEMKGELTDVKGRMGVAVEALNQISAQLNSPKVKEFHLTAKEATLELFPGKAVAALTYNGQMPGPPIRAREGDFVRVILHNELKVPTSLYFHGLILPGSVDGLPLPDGGLVAPGGVYAYQFQVTQPGTFWYHPQVVHADQQARGLYGAIVVEPSAVPRGYEDDHVIILGQCLVAAKAAAGQADLPAKGPKSRQPRPGSAAPISAQSTLEVISPTAPAPPAPAVTYFTINGKSAPAIPPLEVRKGQRIRLRVINACQQLCPLHLTGHKFELVATNGGDGLEPHVTRDSVAVQPGDRLDLEFSADNPGTWSLASELAVQTSNNGRFPGGMALVVRYLDQLPAVPRAQNAPSGRR